MLRGRQWGKRRDRLCSLPISQTGRLVAVKGLCCCPQILTTATDLVSYCPKSLDPQSSRVKLRVEFGLSNARSPPVPCTKGMCPTAAPGCTAWPTCCPKGRWQGDRALHSPESLPNSSPPDGSGIPSTVIHSPALQGSLWAEGSPRPAASFVPTPPPRRLQQPGSQSSQAGHAGALLGALAPSRGGWIQPRKQRGSFGSSLWASGRSSPGPSLDFLGNMEVVTSPPLTHPLYFLPLKVAFYL